MSIFFGFEKMVHMIFDLSGTLQGVGFLGMGIVLKMAHREFHFKKWQEGRGTLFALN